MRMIHTRHVLAAAFVVALLALAACGPRAADEPTVTGEPTLAPTATSPAATGTPVPTATEAPVPTATATPMPECLLPDAPLAPVAASHVLTAEAGVPLPLDAAAILGSQPAGEVTWAKAQIEPSADIYASAHPVAFDDPAASQTLATFPEIGTYRVALTAAGLTADVEVRVTGAAPLLAKTHGVAAADLFEHAGGGAFYLRRDDPSCQERAFEHALGGITRAGAELLIIPPAFFIDQVDPVPRYIPGHNSLSLTDDAYYAELIGAMKASGLEVFQQEQDGPSENLPLDDWIAREERMKDPAWMEAWFDELRAWVLPRAARAEAAGVAIYGPFNSSSITFKEGAPYDRLWRELYADIREVYSGEIAAWLSLWADERFTMADAVDVAVVDTFAAFFAGRMAVPTEPTIEEARALIGEWLDASEAALTPVPKAYIFFGATSANGQSDSEDQAAREGFVTDLQEQALYYEALLAEVNDRPWIDGVIFGSYDWFDQYQRPPQDWYFDATNESSPRSKPADRVLRVWYDAP